MKFLNDSEENKKYLSNMAQFLLAISIIGCILAIIDFHGDLHSDKDKGTNSLAFGYFSLGFNIFVIIGNLSYIGLSIHRYYKFTKEKNKEIIKSFRGI